MLLTLRGRQGESSRKSIAVWESKAEGRETKRGGDGGHDLDRGLFDPNWSQALLPRSVSGPQELNSLERKGKTNEKAAAMCYDHSLPLELSNVK